MSEEKKVEKNRKDLEVVTGSVKDLDISPVFEHLSSAKPKTKDEKPKHIVIPKEKKKDKDK